MKLDYEIFVHLSFAFLISSIFINNIQINSLAVSWCIFLLFKWITNLHKCTISYIECKIRKIKKEKGFFYNSMAPILNINKHKHRYIIYIFVFIVLIINIYKVILSLKIKKKKFNLII